MTSKKKPANTLTIEKVRMKRVNVSQCRLCLRIVPLEQLRSTRTSPGFQQKIAEAVAVKISPLEPKASVCFNCLRLVSIVWDFREACRKSNLMQIAKLPMRMDNGNWTSEENQESLENCQEMLKRHRSQMDALFKLSGVKEDDFPEEIYNPLPIEVLIVDQSNEPEKRLDAATNESCAEKRLLVTDKTGSETESCDDDFNCSIPITIPVEDDQPKVSSVPKSKYICEICGFIVSRAKEEIHRNRHLDVRPYTCTQVGCELKFFSLESMNDHVKFVHSDFYKYIECEICNRKLKGLMRLKRHMNGHGENNRLKVPCLICGKKYYKHYLIDHQSVHIGALNYSCENCGRQFAAKNNLTTHKKRCPPKSTEMVS
ncbi:zinc finger and BTB domain-containing protein 49-like [Topomyia yanbarensis]|uniref:zinc finger and BTB domain-containing protein 49-like n=1 Tax=Topomyia yanbarensis TaxID=2498891 RepID=UPI00273ADA2C|nr:zinc finger and BTB domain-containing protein 49-like [Topomyia yanbarensis]